MKALKIKKQNLNKIIKKVIRSIKNGKVIVCPTDTVYGLVCDATNKKAVDRLFKIKKRFRNRPIPIFVKDIKMAKNFAHINKDREKFLKEIWPGAITVVLKPKRNLLPIISQGKNTIGLRIPDDKFTLSLINKINRPLAESSANISGQPATTRIKEVLKQFKNQKEQPDLIISGGNLEPSKPSLVIDLTLLPAKILRA